MARSRRTAMSALSAAAILGAGLAIAGPPTVATAGRLITGGEVKNGSLTGKDIRNGSVTAADLAPSARKGKVGPQGPKGDPGPAGGSGSGTEIVDWTFSHEADGGFEAQGQTTEKIPAGTQVRVLRTTQSFPAGSSCRVNPMLGDNDLPTYQRTNDEVVLREAQPVSLVAYCSEDDFGPATPVPSFEYTITLSLTDGGVTAERSLQ